MIRQIATALLATSLTCSGVVMCATASSAAPGHHATTGKMTPKKKPTPVRVEFSNGCIAKVDMANYWQTIHGNYGGWEKKGAKTALFTSDCGTIGVPWYKGKWGKPVLMEE